MARGAAAKSTEAFRTIGEVADELGIPKHVLRFWELKFPQLRPMKRGGGRRFYRPEDVRLLHGIRQLLHGEGFTIKGVQKILRQQGIESVKALGATVAPADPDPVASTDQTPVPARSRPRVAEGPVGLQAIPAMREAVLLAIGELEICRAILKGDRTLPDAAVPGASPVAG